MKLGDGGGCTFKYLPTPVYVLLMPFLAAVALFLLQPIFAKP